jgi:hypothetical protein
VTTDPYPLHKLLEMQNTAAAPIDDSISPTGSIELPLHSRGIHIGVLTVTIRELSVLESAKLSSEMAEGISRAFKKRMFSEKHAETYRIAYEGLARIAGILDVVNGIAAVTSLALVRKLLRCPVFFRIYDMYLGRACFLGCCGLERHSKGG